MVIGYYLCMLVSSILFMLAYLSIWHKHFNIHITLIFILVPLSNLGYTFVASAQTLEAAIVATKMAYIGGCYLLFNLMLAVLNTCDIKMPKQVFVALLGLCTALYCAVLTIGYLPIYYRSVSLVQLGGASALEKEYGPLHTVFIAMELSYYLVSIAALIYSYLRKRQVSRTNIQLLLLTETVSFICFFGGRWAIPGLELLPIGYVFALAVYLFISSRISLYRISDVTIDSMVQAGATGFASFDFKLRYLGSNKTAKAIFPQLYELTVDGPLAQSSSMDETVRPWLEAFDEDQTANEHLYRVGEQTYKIQVQYLYSGRYQRGYQLVMVDDTPVQRYIALLNSFNTDLQREVEHKTAHILEMHDNLVLGMATMVESRDNSTGGHIRRTSEGVRLLIEQIQASGLLDLPYEFCRNVIKAAPMHDLGKIAVDDAVLRKPGRFTPEDYEKMKVHAAEGARIVHEILVGTDDDAFRLVAENVAHYHHERWDGSGYPEGLAGEDIPLEARIMAIADVYDALVSKRVYKEAMSFEQADAIIMEGMGSQFDPGLEPCYIQARPYLERYYAEQASAA